MFKFQFPVQSLCGKLRVALVQKLANTRSEYTLLRRALVPKTGLNSESIQRLKCKCLGELAVSYHNNVGTLNLNILLLSINAHRGCM